MVVGMFKGGFWIVGAVWTMVKKADAKDTVFEDHYSNIIKTFWRSLGLFIIGFYVSVRSCWLFYIDGSMYLVNLQDCKRACENHFKQSIQFLKCLVSRAQQSCGSADDSFFNSIHT